MEILERELSYVIQGCFYSVYNRYGNGLKESVYQKALIEELEKKELYCIQQLHIDIFSLDSGKRLGTYVPDIVVNNKIIIEIKAKPFTIKNDLKQQRSYLQVSIYEIAYLVNFGTPKLEFYRSIFTNDRKPFITKLKNS